MESDFQIGGVSVEPGVIREIRLKVSERIVGGSIEMPILVVRANEPGPVIFVSAVLHGDELNGLGIVHELMTDNVPALTAGTLVLIPVVNIMGFEAQMRYMPDRRDLNRCFPGRKSGSMSSRVAYGLYHDVIKHCDFGIDLHSAATGRVNFPNVRGDLTQPGVRRLARAFGCELMVKSKGPEGSLRRVATEDGCPTILLEAGEPGKIEPTVVELGVQGVCNVLRELNMLDGKVRRPPYQTRVDKSMWVRADTGGILRFHVAPGDPVQEGQAIATNVNVFRREQNVITAPLDGVVLGMTVLPAVQPGEPVCHLAIPRSTLRTIRRNLKEADESALGQRIRADLATSISVTEREGEIAQPTLADEIVPVAQRKRL
jgi:predicted deacylase